MPLPVRAAAEKRRCYKCWVRLTGPLREPCFTAEIRFPICLIRRAYRALEIGFIFQAFHLLPTFTALENVQIPMFESRLPRSERKRSSRRIAEVGWIGSIASTISPPSCLAEKGNALLSPGVWPIALPSYSRTNPPATSTAKTHIVILELIIRIHREQKMTLVLVTHDLSIAQRASRTIQMKDGRIVSDRPINQRRSMR